jgi:hypothetical protein
MAGLSPIQSKIELRRINMRPSHCPTGNPNRLRPKRCCMHRSHFHFALRTHPARSQSCCTIRFHAVWLCWPWLGCHRPHAQVRVIPRHKGQDIRQQPQPPCRHQPEAQATPATPDRRPTLAPLAVIPKCFKVLPWVPAPSGTRVPQHNAHVDMNAPNAAADAS